VPLDITWRFAALSHRDFLGALLALGIVRGKIGDIIVGDGKCTVFAEKTVASFIVQNLIKVGAAGVKCSISDGGIAVREEHFQRLSGTVASERLDCVVSSLTGRSRSAAAELIAGGLVSVDFETRCENSSEISGGATVSIRGHGRFVIDRLGPRTRKGRLSFEARKYL
jgi:RNA-binding protein YlmH